MAQTILTVPNISCHHCEAAITRALTPLEGVRQVAVDIPRKEVRVEYDEGRVSLARLQEVLAEEEYPVSAARPAG
ncbi:MAG: heavy-metal-associated domain-containing protein [Chloroflexi bacterium]|nr:heavy-metal-associated domain-containing protein [Chloroflexota bacterium]